MFLCVKLFTSANTAVAGPAGSRGEDSSPEVLLHCSGLVPQRPPSIWAQERLGAPCTGGKSDRIVLSTPFKNYVKQRRICLFVQDFGDGGAFPEIHVAQFPLEMGRKRKTSNALAVQVDAEGKIKYDAIARQGQGKDKVCLQDAAVVVHKVAVNLFCNSLFRHHEKT